MHKLFSLFAFLSCLTLGFGQTPFTITADNFPVYAEQTYNGPITPAGPNLVPAANGSWDYSAYHTTTLTPNDYLTETDPFYTSKGIDVYISGFKLLTPTLGYDIYQEIDFNPTGVYESAMYVSEQGFGLGNFTGNTADSIIFPLQGKFFEGGRKVMQFPATFQTAWTSKSRRSVDFFLTINAAGLHHVPSEHRFTFYRSDSIVAWGSMRVYAGGVPSIAYPVLIDRSSQYAIDSFFVGGAPAPAQLLAAFGISQGLQNSQNNRYTVYREGNSTPLAIFLYGSNNFTTPAQLYVDTNNLATSGVETLADAGYSTLLFPNPVAAGVVTLQVMGNVPDLRTYTITDLSGRMIQNGPAQLQGGDMQVQFNAQVPNGTYILQVLDAQGIPRISEQFLYSR